MSKWYRWTVIAAVIAVLIVAVRTCQVSQSPLSGLDDFDAEEALEAGLTLKDVTLEQPDENGDLLWKVKAQEVSYSPDQKIADIRKIDGEFYEEGEIAYRVTADRGEVLEDGKTFFLEDNIVAIAIETDLTLKGNQLEWRSDEDLLIVRDSIDGIHPQINATAQEARLFNQEKRLELDAGVTATTTESPWMGLQSETLVWYLDEKRLESDVPLTIEQFEDEDDDTVTDRIVGNQGEYNLDDNIATLEEDVTLEMLASPLKIESDIVVWDLADELITVDKPLKIEQPKQQLVATANKGRLELQKQLVYLIDNVRAESTKNQSLLTTDQLTWQLESQDVTAVGNVNYRQSNPETTLKGDRAVGNLTDQTVVVTGSDVITEIIPE